LDFVSSGIFNSVSLCLPKRNLKNRNAEMKIKIVLTFDVFRVVMH
jgi:hypothetical protein